MFLTSGESNRVPPENPCRFGWSSNVFLPVKNFSQCRGETENPRNRCSGDRAIYTIVSNAEIMPKTPLMRPLNFFCSLFERIYPDVANKRMVIPKNTPFSRNQSVMPSSFGKCIAVAIKILIRSNVPEAKVLIKSHAA